MLQRYNIIRHYNGLFDSTATLAVTDNLCYAVSLVENLSIAYKDNPCYSFDFKKIVPLLHHSLDWCPGSSFASGGKAINCRNYNDYLKQKP